MSNAFLRVIILASVSAFGLAFSSLTDCNAENAVNEQALDGVCKGDPMPAGFVAVKEMESAECKASAPGRKNAWLIDKVHDKIVSCAPPDYASGYPPAIAFMICDRVRTSQCAPSIDGSPNGYLLTMGTTCNSSRVKSICIFFGSNKRYRRSEEEKPWSSAAKINPTDELEFYKLSVVQRHPTCSQIEEIGKVYNPDKIFYVSKLSKGEPLPLCAEINWEGLKFPLWLLNAVKYNTRVIVIRQFYTDLCPDYVLDGVPQAFNAIVVQRLAKEEWVGRDIFMCALSLKRKPKMPFKWIPATGGEYVEESSAKAYEPTPNQYTVKRVFQDDRCGTGTEANAYEVRFWE